MPSGDPERKYYEPCTPGDRHRNRYGASMKPKRVEPRDLHQGDKSRDRNQIDLENEPRSRAGAAGN
jgi:hypothetical protein